MIIRPLRAFPERSARRAQAGPCAADKGMDTPREISLPMVPPHAAQAYARIGVETGVAAASPHRLVLMLYDGVLDSIALASHHLAAGRIADKGRAISKAIAIVESGLRPALDRARGGEIAAQLDALYAYSTQRLLEAGAGNDADRLAEVHALLSDIRGAWQAVADRVEPVGRAA